MTISFRSTPVLAAHAAATLIFGLQSTLHAQDTAAPQPPAAAPPTATTPASPPTNSLAGEDAVALAHAKKSMDAATAAYKKLSSYSESFVFEGKAGKVPSAKGTLAFMRPNRIAMRIEGKGYSRRVVSDGRFLYLADSRLKGKYLKRPLPAGADLIARLIGTQSDGPLFLGAVLNGAALPEVPAAVGTLKVVSVADAPTLSLEMNLKGQGPRAEVKSKFDITLDPTDGLLRTMTYTANAPEDFNVTETHSNIQINPTLPASTFTFTPAPGSKPVDSLEPPPYDARLVVGAKPIAISTNDWKGAPISLDKYKGKVVLLDFWATWCGPCVGEMPNVIHAYNTFKPRGFDIVGVSLDQDKGALAKYVAENKMTWRQIFDGKGWSNAIGDLYGVKSIPFSLLIGRDGKIAAVNPRGELLEPAIKAALAKKE